MRTRIRRIIMLLVVAGGGLSLSASVLDSQIINARYAWSLGCLGSTCNTQTQI